MKEKIKIAVLTKNDEILLWEYRILEKLLSSEFAEIILLIKKEEKPLLNSNRKYSGIYQFHEKIDKYIFKNGFDYNEKINLLNLIKEVPLISYDETEVNVPGLAIKEIPPKIKDYQIDVILNFGVESINSDLLKTPKYGIWSYKIGDDRIIRSEPSAYWEIVKKMPEIGCTVSMLRQDRDYETFIYRSSVSTFTKSINVNRNRVYGLASLIIPRLIKNIYLSGDSYLDKSLVKFNRDVEILNTRLYTYPNSITAFWNLVIIITSRLYSKIIYQKKIDWFLLYKINENSRPFPVVIDSFKPLTTSKDKFWADPFVITKDKYHYIFVEEYLFKTLKAHISVLKIDDKGTLLSSDRIIERPYHMSYPFIFELNDKYYMIPESRGNRTIQLFSCKSFPDKWEFEMNLMENISATDSTLFFYNNKWWLFTAVDELNSSSIPFSELFLYFSDDLFSGNWQSHPMNPIVTDIKTSRPAGRIFVLNNKVYRPSQDCSGSYGKAFNLNQITIFSETAYEEILVSKVEADWSSKIIGTHTFNFNNKVTVIDASPLKKRIRLHQK